MEEFFITHKKALIFVAIVIVSYIALMWLTRFWAQLVSDRLKKRFNVSNFKTVKTIKRILKVLWTTLAALCISYVFLNEKFKGFAEKNFFLILYIGIVIVFTLGIGAFLQMLFNRQIDEKRENKEDATNLIFLKYAIVAGVYIVGGLLIVAAFPDLRGLAQTALGGAGIMAVVIGIASQEALGNIVSGMFIMAFKPFKVGDIIKVTDELMGTVHDITLRHIVIKNFQNKMIVIPNAIINKERVVNYHLEDEKICQWITIGISYDSSIDKAKSLIREECEKHPFLIDNRSYADIEKGVEKVKVKVVNLGESSVDIKIWAWARNFDEAFNMKNDLLESIKKRFDAEGIEIPFPHRTLVFKDKLKTTVVNPNAQ